MSLKDNFNQAVKEILKKDGLVGDDLSKESKKKSELDRYIDPPRQAEPVVTEPETASAETETEQYTAAPVMPEPEPEPIAPTPEPVQDYGYSSKSPYVQPTQTTSQFGSRPSSRNDNFGASQSGFNSGAGNYGAGGFGGVGIPPVPPRTPNTPPPYAGGSSDKPYYETEETTVISRNTIIDGNIRSFANINIDGSVKGDVKITKNISVTGKVVGDIECNNSIMTGASMQGNLASKGQVQLDRDSLILGDISAQYLDLNGKIKGNIEVGGKAEFKTDAVVLGNITASTITVLDGATIQGYVNTTFLQESSSSIFPDTIAVSD
ncbi:MAG: polymer-forming cytoskeletal protein [Oscillospiraceae bacterium]|nr:polymer-forming cytoskeletal protein [Oscillospiraceae bacterium]